MYFNFFVFEGFFLIIAWLIIYFGNFVFCTVKLGIKELFDKEQIGIKEPFPVTNLTFTS